MVRQGDVRRPQEVPRITVRYPVASAVLEWSPPRGGRVRGDKPKRIEAEFADLSVAGALIKSPANDRLYVGARVPIHVGGEDGIIEIRNMRQVEGGVDCYYGVVFHRMSEALQAALYGAIARLRNDSRLESEWKRT